MNNTLTKNKVSIYHLCFVALAICINVAGGQIAVIFHLPIYLDSIGTFFVGATLESNSCIKLGYDHSRKTITMCEKLEQSNFFYTQIYANLKSHFRFA